MTTPVSKLEEHLGYWLRLVSNHVSANFRRKVEAEGMTVSEWVVLRTMYGKTATSSTEIALAIGMTKGAVSKVIAQLEAKKLVSRAVDLADRRHQSLVLTAAGKRMVPRLAELADENEREAFTVLTLAQRKSLLAALRALVDEHELTTVPID